MHQPRRPAAWAGGGVSVVSWWRDLLFGRRIRLTPDLTAAAPELKAVRWRLGGLPPRIAGWCLGRRTVAAVTLWNTVYLGRNVHVTLELLLHEFRHVQQFHGSRAFPLLYLWETVIHGYHRNRYEQDAREYAARRIRAVSTLQAPTPAGEL